VQNKQAQYALGPNSNNTIEPCHTRHDLRKQI
jgi:hypothetical protein